MIVEHALLPVIPGQEDAFEASMRQALPIITSAPKCHGAEVRRQIEDGSIYLLLVQWESVEAHGDFRVSELFSQWKALTHHFYSTPADVKHFFEPLR
ncbi:MAG: antibiotic biosynthesis monooxygenase family protein [Acidimicrobiales bacterium]|jgi:heme-degrading monooxygenase HmoA